ncbi:protein FAR1-RELATED SEQUENCE 5-like isoform X3 [Dendrobium catenatum]|nr:protein FAR1-RELATED SEQUENCE 5-like isoform X3 [Dendrobium catenatum]XP_028553413.1 protein FAR1-RELATED SEQUENCE 5-like isoform X3 [Dendrobium catenatum]
MEYTSSEDDELIEDYVDLEEDIMTSDVEQQAGEVAASLHFFNHQDNSLSLVHTIGNELIVSEADVKSQDPHLGMEFESDTVARLFYNAYALRLGFGIRVARSRSERRKGIEVLVMKRFVCLKEGHHKKKVTELANKKKRKRLSIRDGCPAMMEVVRRGADRWVITKLVLEHTHVVVSPDKVREIQLNQLTGKDREHENLLREMRQKIFGEGGAQGLLEHFKKVQAENSGFFYSMNVDDRNCLANIFWADSRARIAYKYFGDAVVFDTTYKKNENMMPFAAFSGVNHHLHPVNFGCALIIDKTESSYAWLFETWLTAMSGRHPISLTTDQGKALGAAVAKAFPTTRHRICKWRVLSRCKKKLADVYSRYPNLPEELRKYVLECETSDVFEACWKLVLDKYNLRENSWLQLVYNIRNKWVPAYLKDSFFAELHTTQRSESINTFFRKNFDTKISLQAFISKFDQAMDNRYEKELQEDFDALRSQQILKTDSHMEKQTAGIYTRAVFERFQAELVEALDHYTEKIQDGAISKYTVERHGDDHIHRRHIVAFNESEKKAVCTCYKFESSGILCKHVLVVFFFNGVVLLPEHYILKRWTKKAKSGIVFDEGDVETQSYCQESPTLRYHDIFHDALKVAEKGAASIETYKFAKEVLLKAFSEIAGLEEETSCFDLLLQELSLRFIGQSQGKL